MFVIKSCHLNTVGLPFKFGKEGNFKIIHEQRWHEDTSFENEETGN